MSDDNIDANMKANVDKVHAMSTALTAAIIQDFEKERPDLVLLAVLDTSVKVVRLFNPNMTSVEACDSILQVLKEIRDGEARDIPCNQVGCDIKADCWYVWPTDGERKHSCFVHTQAAIGIARVLGYTIVAHRLRIVEPLKSSPPESMGG